MEISDSFQAVTVICGEPEATDKRVLSLKRRARKGLCFVVHLK